MQLVVLVVTAVALLAYGIRLALVCGRRMRQMPSGKPTCLKQILVYVAKLSQAHVHFHLSETCTRYQRRTHM